MGKTVTVRIDDETYERIKAAADAERRTISNFIENATMNYVEQGEFVDDHEMAGILKDEALLRNIKTAMGDIKSRKYRLVD
jgi:predicted transcriptional regulator